MSEEILDGDAFTRLVAPLRPELHAHCYRILGSTHDADDALQEALVRAWRGRAGFAGRGSLRSWLYTVATRTSLDLAAARGRRALPMDLGPASTHPVVEGNAPVTEVAWLGPYPDREAVELAFVAALQHLPGNQRAALLLFDVVGFTVAEIATIMDTSTTAVNSALARARRLLADLGPDAHRPASDAATRRLVADFADALAGGHIDRFVALLTEDVTWAMPPLRHWYAGRAAVADFAVAVPMTRCPSWRFRFVGANGQPAVAFYVGATPDAVHEAWSITVLTVRDDHIAAITSFLGPEHFPAFALPPSVPGGS